MIGSGLKKLAAENGMKVSKGVAYGSLRGYAAALFEGAGWKKITFSATFPDSAQRGLFIDAINKTDVKTLYRVTQVSVGHKNIVVEFFDNPGTMKKIYEFLDWFAPLLEQYSATKVGICPECGGQVTDGCWKLIDGVAYYMHSSCAEKVRIQISEEEQTRKQEAEGSYGAGLLGALLGAGLGAVVWALVLLAGYVASLVGLLIGFLAEKGYNLLQGKKGKGKLAILIIAIVAGVVLGTLGAEAFTLASMIKNGEVYLTYGEIPGVLIMLLQEDPQFVSAISSNILMGLLFAGLGVFALLRKANSEVADIKFIDLD